MELRTQAHVEQNLLGGIRAARPLELLDRGLELYRRHFVPLTALTLTAWGPVAALLIGWLYFIHDNQSIWGTDAFLGWSALLIASLLFALYHFFLLSAAGYRALYHSLRGEPFSLGRALRESLKRSGTLMLNAPILFLSHLFAWSCYLFPGLLVAARLDLITPVAAIEDEVSHFRVLPRSFRLSRERGGGLIALFFGFRGLELIIWLNLWLFRILVVYFSHSLVSFDLSFLSRLPYGLFLLFLLALFLLYPLKICTYALLYVDARVRQEGWDLRERIELLRQEHKVPHRTSEAITSESETGS